MTGEHARDEFTIQPVFEQGGATAGDRHQRLGHRVRLRPRGDGWRSADRQ
jgi:hypothetical protein